MTEGAGITLQTFVGTAAGSQEAWYQGVFGALILIVILAMVMERALAVVFEWGIWDVWLARKKLRAPIAFIVAYVICAALRFDILIVIDKGTAARFIFNVGVFLTAATIAGGSKGAITLFQNVLNFAKGGNPMAVAAVTTRGDVNSVLAEQQ